MGAVVNEQEMFAAMREIRRLMDEVGFRGNHEARTRAIVMARASGWTLEEIASAVGMSREYIRQKLKKAGAL